MARVGGPASPGTVSRRRAAADAATAQVRLTAPRSELGRVVARHLAHTARPAARPAATVLVNLAAQAPNTLLHDGHAWQRLTPRQLVAQTRRMLADPVSRDADYIVHASYAFLDAVDDGAVVGDRLRPIVAAAREAEAMVLDSGRRACVVRLGYLYGPELRDLRAYRIAFRIGRPYWAGPSTTLQHHLHTADAARALLLVARRRSLSGVVSATDDHPATFGTFMDHFARLIGNPLPLHLPALTRPLAHVVVAEEHMQMVEIGAGADPHRRPPGFRPLYPDYRAGLAQVVDAWSG
jgi:hypothetical protein